MPQKTHSLVVIGAGAPRTGTVSQKVALELLLGQPCYHMGEALGLHNSRRHIPMWIQAVESGLSKSLADEILGNYAACVDYPTASFYKELMQHYPNAKVILSVRDTNSWVESMQSSILKAMHTMERFPRPLKWLLGIGQADKMIDAVFRREFGDNYNLADSEFMARQFEERNDSIRRVVPSERLLEFRVSDGWAPLCQFLNLPVPDKPFPRLNDRKQVERALNIMTAITYVSDALATASCIGLAVWIGRRFLN